MAARSPLHLVCVLVAIAATSAPAYAQVASVEECVRLALARAPAVRKAGFDVDTAGWQISAANAAFTPKWLAQFQYGKSGGFDTVVTNGGETAALLTVETTILDGGLRTAKLASARAELRSATETVRQRRADVTRAVRVAYAEAVEGRSEAEIQRTGLDFWRGAATLLEKQEPLGLATQNDVLRARLAVDAAEAGERSAKAQIAVSLRELEVLTGTKLEAASLDTELPRVSLPATDDELIDASPVVAEASAEAERARHDADAVTSEGRPQFAFTASVGALGVDPVTTFKENGGGQFMLGMDVPLFDGGAAASRTAAAIAAANSAAAALDEARQDVVAELARLRIEANKAEADLDAWRHAVPGAEENFALVRARYFGGGSVRLLEVLDALSQLVDARTNVARFELAYEVAIAARRQIIGEETP